MSLLDLDYNEPLPPAKKPDLFSRGLFFLGIALFIGGLAYYIFTRLTYKEPPINPEIIYSSDNLTDEEILGSVETDFNLGTGTASHNLGVIPSSHSGENVLE